MISSRDLIMNLPASARTATGAIKARPVDETERNLIKPPEVKAGPSPFAVLVVNTNRSDNEEIFTRFGVTGKGPAPLPSNSRR